MPRKAQMNANYRRNEKLLEDGEIDVPCSEGVTKQYVDDADAATLATAKAYTDDEIAGIDVPEYTAGTGIEITSEKVINNTAPGTQYVAGDGIDISNNTISSLVKSLEFVSYNELIIPSLPGGYGGHITIDNLDNNYDYFIFVEVLDGSYCTAPSFVTRGGSSIDLYVFNKGGADKSGTNIGQYTIYRTKKKESWNYIHIIGSIASNANMIPMGGNAGEVLAKISDTNYSATWKTIGKTITTNVLVPPTATLPTIYDVLMDAPLGTEIVINKFTFTVGTSSAIYAISGKFTKVEPIKQSSQTISAMFLGAGAVQNNGGSPSPAPMIVLDSGDIKYSTYNYATFTTIGALSGTEWDIIVMTYN